MKAYHLFILVVDHLRVGMLKVLIISCFQVVLVMALLVHQDRVLQIIVIVKISVQATFILHIDHFFDGVQLIGHVLFGFESECFLMLESRLCFKGVASSLVIF